MRSPIPSWPCHESQQHLPNSSLPITGISRHFQRAKGPVQLLPCFSTSITKSCLCFCATPRGKPKNTLGITLQTAHSPIKEAPADMLPPCCFMNPEGAKLQAKSVGQLGVFYRLWLSFFPALHRKFCVPKPDSRAVLPNMVGSRNLGLPQQKARGLTPCFTQPGPLGHSLLWQAGDAHVRTYLYM